MAASLARAAPIRFLIGVVTLWTAGRGVFLTGWRPPQAPPRDGSEKAAPMRPGAPAIARPDPAETVPERAAATPEPGIPAQHVASLPMAPIIARHPASSPMTTASSIGETPGSSRESPGIAAVAASIAPAARPGRWSGTAWLFARGGGRASPLAPGGQIGGGQTGARLLYRLDRTGRLSAAARISTTIGGPRQSEAAIGLDLKPVPALPFHLMAERRIAIDHGGRNAWTLGAAGGVYDLRIAGAWRLDGYAEAGVVGARRHDLYTDGGGRITRRIGLGSGRSLALGGGLWGAVQPGAARLDIGPSAVLRLPVADRSVALALDWRERIAGGARPGSSLAVTLATDF